MVGEDRLERQEVMMADRERVEVNILVKRLSQEGSEGLTGKI